MPLASRVKWYLDVNRTPYEILRRRRPAPDSPLPEDHVARSLLFEDEQGYLMVVLPASRTVDLDELNSTLDRQLVPVSIEEASGLFFDCDAGSVPAVGSAYGLPMLIDDALLAVSDVYFDAGDAEALVHVDSEHFLALNTGSQHAPVSGTA